MKKKLRKKLRSLMRLRARQSTPSTESEDGWPRLDGAPPNIPLPSSRKEIYKMFTLSRTNQILQGHSPTTADTLAPQSVSAKMRKKARELRGGKKWIELVASELFSAKINVVPKAAEFNADLVSTDPRRGLFKSIDEFGTPHAHLCKLVRQHLIRNIIRKHALVEPRINTNVSGKVPTKEELDQWKLRRAKKSEERRKKKRVISTKKKRVPSRLRPCRTCGDFHFRRQCGNRDWRINLMVKQIYQKTEVIKETMADAWEKIEALESAYEDMLNKALRIQSNRVCIENLTGDEYPGENHPQECPCAEQAEKEELDRQRLEDRLKEEEERKKEEEERKYRERLRREQILEMRKKRFYTRLKQDGQSQFPAVPGPSKAGFANLVRFQEDRGRPPFRRDSDATTASSGILEDDPNFDHRPSQSVESKVSPWLKYGLNELTRLEASRRRTNLTLMDGFDDPIRKERSLLSKALGKGFGRDLDLIVMDGTVKSIGATFEEDGGRIDQQLSIRSISFDEASDKGDSIRFCEDQSLGTPWTDPADVSLPASLDPSVSDRLEKSAKDPTEESELLFNEFLDLMEVF